MVNLNSALVLYFGALILYLVSIFFDSLNLELFSRPIIIPSIYCFYFISVKGKVNLLFSISILSFFIGEILYLISASDLMVLGLIFFVIPYFIVTYFLCQDFLYYFKNKKYSLKSFSFYIVLLLLFYLFYNGLLFNNEASKIEFSIYIIYGILLLVMGMIASLILFNFNNRTILFMILMVSSFIVSDLFFIFSEKMKDVIALKLINVISQQSSYLLFVCYFINRTRFEIDSKK